MQAIVGLLEKETHLHVESARALGDGVEGRVGLESGGGAEDETGNGELHFDVSQMYLRLDTTLDRSDKSQEADGGSGGR